MGTYINKGNEGFRSAINGEYVDKTGMIEFINSTLNTERRYTCVTRSRRFGKSMAADMLCAYYATARGYLKACPFQKCEGMKRTTLSTKDMKSI